ncbi:MAG: winged helix-turn-helix domain-containing protein [Alphaproteobacteria bacterium]|nr:winged helix-turn-helix domain-containing protein [Alphaproteobacteria bacterium]
MITVGAWRAVRATGELTRGETTERLEPKVMDLLFLLAAWPGTVLSKDDIMTTLWPNVIVGDDALARAVSRLRRALADDVKTPVYIETLPKRGYRLIAEVRGAEDPAGAGPVTRLPWVWPSAGAAAAILGTVIVAIVLWSSFRPPVPSGVDTLVERANDFYFQYKRTDNEAAITLFERILTDRPDHAPALAGLANALVQRVIRWPNEPGAPEYTKLADALRSGRTKTASAQQLLARAHVLAERAVAVAPDDPSTHKALGFVHGAMADFPAAIASYERAVALDADAWGPLINIGDVLEISNRPREALPYFERAYGAMTRVYDKQATRVRPWYAELGVLIADRHKDAGDTAEAESWYRRVLVYAPLHRAATEHLAAMLKAQGNIAEADALCANLKQRAGVGCGG